MIRLLDRYLAGTVIQSTGLVLGILLALSLFFGFIAEMDNIGEGDYSLDKAALYVLLTLPTMAYEMLPVSVLLGALLGLGNLAANSELTVMRAAGLPLWRLAVAVAGGAGVMALLAVAVGDWALPPASQMARNIKVTAKAGKSSDEIAGNVWFRDGNRFVQLKEFGGTQPRGGIEIYAVDAQGRLESAESAERVWHDSGDWFLDQWQGTKLGEDRLVRSAARQQVWETGLTPRLLGLFVVQPEMFTTLGLSRYVDYLQANGLESGPYERALWTKLVTPVSVILLAILALPFVFGPLRSAAAGQRLLIGVMIGMAYYLANKIFSSTGQVYGLDPILTAWLPTMLLALAASIALRRVR